jgi:glucose/arabinose dehydrogenase
MPSSVNCLRMTFRKNSSRACAKWSADIPVRKDWFGAETCGQECPWSTRAFIVLFLLFFFTVSASAQLVRRANTTLRLPFEPVSANGDIVLNEAFPGISFDSPVSLRSLPGETNKLFVVERYGRVMVINDLRNPSPEIFLDIHDRVFASTWIENDRRTEGLSSIAFHPKFAENGRFFVSYGTRVINSDGEEEYYNCLSEFRASDDRTIGLPDSEITYIRQFDEGDGHNINDLHFGADGYLYVAIGDEGDGGLGDDYDNAQKIDKDFFSAIMRIDVDERPGNLPPNPHPASIGKYWIPADNPFVGATNFLGTPIDPTKVRTEFWAVGVRNPWRISFDPLTQIMYEGDVGQHTKEEINRIVKGGNYGWSFKEGTAKGPKGPAPNGFAFIDPLFEYGPGYDQYEGFSVTGGVVYRGSRIPSLYGNLIFADYGSGSFWAMNVDQDPPSRPVWLLNKKGIASFGYDPRDGEILVVYHSETEPGKIYRMEVSGGSNESYPPTLADTGVFSDLNTFVPNEGIIPFEVNLPFWSDGAIKSRWFSIPDPEKTITFSPDQNWRFPKGSVWIKHFDLETTPGDLSTRKRIETRVLVACSTRPGIYGLTYKWDEGGTNATLVGESGDTRALTINDLGGPREQTWRFPSRSECLACHTTAGGLALGFNTAQLNRDHDYGSLKTNEIGGLAAAGYFENPPANLRGLRALAAFDDEAVSRTYRVRSYLSANCSFCHQPGGSSLAGWDARAVTPLSFANIVNGALHNTLGDLSNRVVVASSPEHSAIFRRISNQAERMPPVGSSVLDQKAIALLQAWISEDLPKYEVYNTWAGRVFVGRPDVDASPDGDADDDGQTNYEEFLAGTNPLSSASRAVIQPEIKNGQVKLSLTQQPNRALLIESTHSVTYPSWEFLNAPGNQVTFPVQSVDRSIFDVFEGGENYYRIRVLEP